MKYSELISFEPINEVVKFDRLSEDDYRQSLVRNFVFSATYEKVIVPELCKNLDYTASHDTFGLQIVGNYGTGKSHLMSLFSLVAENADYLPLVQNESARKVLGNIAGKYKVIRFELGSDDELWRLVCYQIDKKLQEWGIDYSITSDDAPDMYIDKLTRMMAQFEAACPTKGLMIVIDEMLSYLKGRATDDRLNRDLAVLQALGQASDHSKFRMVFGVQELIYNTPQFQFAADMLGRVNDRYRQITITKQDVQFVVQQRLLRKNENQKSLIRKHLGKFVEFFTDMHANIEEYVNLFPVNPTFFENFQQIKIGKSQREVLKTLSSKFDKMKDEDVPDMQPGLICYDHYWDDLNVPAMMTEPDVRRVSDIMEVVHQKIEENFTGGRANNIPLAHRIANACAVKILQDSLDKTNGVSAENLVDDLCYLDTTCLDRDFLKDKVGMVAQQIVTATVGQYFEKNEQNQEYHLRIEGGVNYEQKIKDYVETMDVDKKDSHFFNFLVEYLPIEVEQYRKGFKIYRHRIDWKSHKTMLDGYIFLGNPAERSTTQPQQNFYIYFMPIFNKAKIKHGDEPDSIYVHMDKFSQEMKDLLELYAAAEEQIASADSSQKAFYQQYKDVYAKKLKTLFLHDFMENTEIYYQGELQTINPKMMAGGTKDQVIGNIASTLLEDYFCQKMPDYPKFTLLHTSLTSENRDNIIKGARMRIANPAIPNRDGDAVLAALGLLQDNQLSMDASIYAQSIRQKLEDKGEGQVLNRDEILHRFYKEWNDDWRSNDYGIEADLEFLVLSALVALGEIEIDYTGGKNINAANMKEIVDLPKEGFYSFSHLRRPKGMNVAAVRELFLGITGKDMTGQLQNQEIYTQLVSQAKAIATNAVQCSHDISNGMYLDNIEIISPTVAGNMKVQLSALSGLCDKLPAYASFAKMRNLPSEWTAEKLRHTFEAKQHIRLVKDTSKFVEDMRSRLSYLNQALQYMTDASMKEEVRKSLEKVNDVVKMMNDSQQVGMYKAELDAWIDKYANWYLSEYKRLHVTAMQDTEKRQITNSNFKQVCDTVCGADHDKGYFSVVPQYREWGRKMSQLVLASESCTLEALHRSPYYAGFNPVAYQGKQLPHLGELKDELTGIFDNINDTLHQILSDEQLLKNQAILDDSQQGLLKRFANNDEDLSPLNAERLVEIVEKLHAGMQEIKIDEEGIRKVLNRPMTPDDAIKAFRQYINELTGGKKDDNIRIILK